MKNEILAELNAEQRRAVKTTEGPILVLAGAGSGKTKVITHRIAHLLASGKARPENILTATFTNKAADEIRRRVGHLLGTGYHKGFMPFMGTFHGIAVKILRRDGSHIGISDDFIIFDQNDSISAVNKAFKEMGIDAKRFSAKTVATIISSNKNELVNAEMFSSLAATPLQKVAAAVWPLYQRLLEENRALDFDDILLRTVELFTNAPKVLHAWQGRLRYIMVDEYQDTNAVQYRLIKHLASGHGNICVVGDDWQSIYSWRGADYRNILNFERDYPDAAVIKLEQNYRSSAPILTAAHKVISHNRQRSDKQLWTKKRTGLPVRDITVTDEREEGEYIVGCVREMVNRGDSSFSDFAVLYRTNAQSRALEEQFIRYQVPYQIVGGVAFYQRREIKDLLAYMRFIFQPDDRVSFERIVNVPPRGLGKTSLDKFESWQRNNGYSLSAALERASDCGEITSRARTGLTNFWTQVKRIKRQVDTLSPAEAIKLVMNKFDYLNYLDDGSIQGAARAENVRELISVANENGIGSLEEFLQEVALMSDIDRVNSRDEAVTLMTLHAAKGLEFKHVFIVGMEEGIFPHSRALFDADEMEEERRLCYVGMTRAKEDLRLIHASRRLLYGSVTHNPPSRFLAEISEESLVGEGFPVAEEDVPVGVNNKARVKIGDRVRHPVFGAGTIEEIDNEMAHVKFEQGKRRVLNLAFAPLEKI